MIEPKLNYKAEIDGLRAIAVFSVILYHAQIVLFDRIWFTGGFLGVDIFFVISGYLITRIILVELETTGSFSFLNFYERRARRILPMLFIIIYVSLPFAWQNLLPADFVDYTESILASLFFASNFYFYFNTTEYGAGSALLKPFLHTWSLSVEEQFYLVFPILAISIFRVAQNRFFIFLIGGAFVSIVFSEMMETKDSIMNFYLPLSRFWELGTGSILAYRELKFKATYKTSWAKLLPMLGISIITVSIFAFDGETAHPGFYTLIPVFGVCLIIGFSSSNDILGKILGSRPFVWFGLISYSAYIWHFPIFAYSRINANEPQNVEKLGLIAFTFILSTISYKLIEQPFRNTKIIGRKLLYVIFFVSALVVVIFGLLAKEHDGFPDRFPKGWNNFELDGDILKKGFFHHFDLNKKSLATPSSDDINIYIFGNSHSIDFLSALYHQKDIYEGYHFLKLFRSEQLSCFDERDVRFSKYRQALYNSEAYRKSDIFIIASRFVDVSCDNGLKNNPTDADGLAYLIPRLQKDGKKIIILGNTLVLDRIDGVWLEEKIYADAVSENVDFSDNGTFLKYKFDAEKVAFSLQSKFNLETNKRLRQFSFKNGLTYLERSDLFCYNSSQRCLVFNDAGHRIRYDYGHLTLAGKSIFGKLLKNAEFNKILADALHKDALSVSKFIPYRGSLYE